MGLIIPKTEISQQQRGRIRKGASPFSLVNCKRKETLEPIFEPYKASRIPQATSTNLVKRKSLRTKFHEPSTRPATYRAVVPRALGPSFIGHASQAESLHPSLCRGHNKKLSTFSAPVGQKGLLKVVQVVSVGLKILFLTTTVTMSIGIPPIRHHPNCRQTPKKEGKRQPL